MCVMLGDLGGREGATVQGGVSEAEAGGAGGAGVGHLGGAGGPGEGAQEDGGEAGPAPHLGRRGREGLHGDVPQKIFIVMVIMNTLDLKFPSK